MTFDLSNGPEALIPDQSGSPERPAPQELPQPTNAGLSAIEEHIKRGLSGGGEEVRKAETSNPGEQAAPGEKATEESARQPTPEELQVAQTYLSRFQVPSHALEKGLSPAEVVEMGQNFSKMQAGINAKKEAQSKRIEQLEGLLVQQAQGARQPTGEDGKPQSDPRFDGLRKLLADLGANEDEILPALEQLAPSVQSKGSAGDSEALEVARAGLVTSARSQLAGEFPALQHDALYAEVLDTMKGLNLPHYQSLPHAEREVAKMRDAARLVLANLNGSVGPEQTQTRPRQLRSQVSTPQYGQKQVPKPSGEQLAETILRQRGFL